MIPLGSYFKHNFTNTMVSKILFFLAFILTNLFGAFAQLEKDIPALFQELENQPGGIIGVFKKGEIDFAIILALWCACKSDEPSAV